MCIRDSHEVLVVDFYGCFGQHGVEVEAGVQKNVLERVGGFDQPVATRDVRTIAAVIQAWVEGDAHGGTPAQRRQHAMDLQRFLPRAPVVIARHEIRQRERALAVVEFGAKDGGAGKIALRNTRRPRRRYLERTGGRIDERAEDRRAVEARQATPVNRTGLMDERGRIAVSDDSIAHVPSRGMKKETRSPRAGLRFRGTLNKTPVTPVSYTHLRAHETPEHL